MAEMTEKEKRTKLAAFLDRLFMAEKAIRGRNYSQTTWASEHDFSPPSMSQWINGRRLPEGDNLIRLYSEFGPEVLVCLGMGQNALSFKQRLVWQETSNMSEDDLDALLRMIQERKRKENARDPAVDFNGLSA